MIFKNKIENAGYVIIINRLCQLFMFYLLYFHVCANNRAKLFLDFSLIISLINWNWIDCCCCKILSFSWRLLIYHILLTKEYTRGLHQLAMTSMRSRQLLIVWCYWLVSLLDKYNLLIQSKKSSANSTMKRYVFTYCFHFIILGEYFYALRTWCSNRFKYSATL